ncbi:MAG TPA: outer membrane protein assembly factor BamA [Terriglobales bacterium]|nr:outer membrane protein assembly factor BamA [Terriglobales bacterium]
MAPSPSFLGGYRGLRRLIFGSLLTIFLFYSFAGAQQELVAGIEVHGNRRIPAETIKARIFTRPGDVYDEAALERDFNSLWNTGYFEDIRFEREESAKGWIIHIFVKERPTIREINYEGLSSVTKSDVLDRFKDRKVGLSVESQYDPTKVKRAEVVIKELLSEHGRQFSTVRTEVRPIPPAAVSITFVVKEGPKVKVGKIKFTGNQHVKSRILRSAMKNLKPIGVPHSIFLENLFARTYDATKLDEDTERVRQEFQNRGYFKVVVNDPQTNIHDTGHKGFHIPLIQHGPGKAIDITMPIEEGDKYRLGEITFKGNKAIPNSKALRNLFPIRDGDVFDRSKIGKGLEALGKAYGQFGYINFTSVPETRFDEEKKLIYIDIDVDEGKQFYVRRIEFQGNTTTRDKVIRREIVLEEGQVYNQQLWELSLQRLNQLGFFDTLKPEDPSVTERHLDEKNGTVDLLLKVKEKGKNSIGLSGGVSGLAGTFIGLSYSTNNFLGKGETLSISANLGNLERSINFGFTEPYLFDRPLTFGFNVYFTRFIFDQAREAALLTGQQVSLPTALQENLQNYTQSSKGFTVNLSYPIKRSFKRVGIAYQLDSSSIVALTTASKTLFDFLQFSGISGPNALNGIVTSKITPSFTKNSLDRALFPHAGTSIFLGTEFAGLGGTVRTIRPIVSYKHFIPVQKKRNTIGLNLTTSFLTGYGGLVPPPFQRFYDGGENDLRGFDIRSISPVSFLPTTTSTPLRNPDGSLVPKNPANPLQGTYTIPIPVNQIVFPGGDFSATGNVEYRITIAGPVALAPFMDVGVEPILRPSQLKISTTQLDLLNSAVFGCPSLDIGLNCTGGVKEAFSQYLKPLSGTNWVPRMSTGLELQVFLPVINAPFRIYWAYNPLRLDEVASSPIPITRSMFPAGAAGDYTYQISKNAYGPPYQLREPKKTFRFTVATTF